MVLFCAAGGSAHALLCADLLACALCLLCALPPPGVHYNVGDRVDCRDAVTGQWIELPEAPGCNASCAGDVAAKACLSYGGTCYTDLTCRDAAGKCLSGPAAF